MALLRRAERLAGESFGYQDDVLAVPADRLSARLLWAAASLIALAGLVALALRWA